MAKYGIPTWYNGYLYASKGEAGYAKYLDRLLALGKITRWERQVRFTLKANGKHIAVMVVDFVVYYKDRMEVHEFKKGVFTKKFIHDISYWHHCYPNVPYYVVEENGQGYIKRTPDEFLEIPQTPKSTRKQWKWYQWIPSMIFHKIVSSIKFFN